MSIISVDFSSLEDQIGRLISFAELLEQACESIHAVISDISNMELGENEDELKISYNRLAGEKEYIYGCAHRLKKILELYGECENSILSDISRLPLDMPSEHAPGAAYNTPRFTSPETGVFSGHSVINDDWLEKLIF
ncbi:MAG: hypothetical protein NC078_03840 [Ruminococcus sp.]|nr:hypothetical protein [Ruminococcus sp.]